MWQVIHRADRKINREYKKYVDYKRMEKSAEAEHAKCKKT